MVLVFFVVFLGVITVSRTKLPWYGYPLYAPMALACGAFLWARTVPAQGPWRWYAAFLGAAALLLAAAFVALWRLVPEADAAVLGAVLIVGATAASGAWLALRDSAGLRWLLPGGLYLGLLVFFLSPVWNWEVAEDFPVRPLAEAIRRSVPPAERVFVAHPHSRPSLNYYAGREVAPTGPAGFDVLQAGDFLAVPDGTQPPAGAEPVDAIAGWTLVGIAR